MQCFTSIFVFCGSVVVGAIENPFLMWKNILNSD